MHERDPQKLLVYADRLERAADLLKGHWTNGAYVRVQANEGMESGSLSYCAVGALYQCVKVRGDISRLALYDAVSFELDRDIEAWNDSIGQTEANVISTFRRIAGDFRRRAADLISIRGRAASPQSPSAVPSTLPWLEETLASR